MDRKLVIAHIQVQQADCLAAVLFEDGLAVDLSLFPKNETSLLGDVFVGKVENVKESLGAAFVRLSKDVTAFLPLDRQERYLRTGARREGPLRAGDELLVQVSKEAMRGKLPRLSSTIELAGTWIVLSTERIGRRFSSRLSEEERAELYTRTRGLLRDDPYGLIFRTNAAEAAKEELETEIHALAATLDAIREKGEHAPAFTCLHHDPGRLSELLRALPRHAEAEIVTDDALIYRSLVQEENMPENWTIRQYGDDKLSLARLYELPKLIRDLTSRRVWLPSGAYLVIEQTEAFVSVDVNTGKFTGKKASADTMRAVNQEAAREIARQLRLRQLSGTILIDFINMERREDAQALFEAVQDCFAKDPSRTTAVDITKLGILEATRQKRYRSLTETIAWINEMETSDE